MQNLSSSLTQQQLLEFTWQDKEEILCQINVKLLTTIMSVEISYLQVCTTIKINEINDDATQLALDFPLI